MFRNVTGSPKKKKGRDLRQVAAKNLAQQMEELRTAEGEEGAASPARRGVAFSDAPGGSGVARPAPKLPVVSKPKGLRAVGRRRSVVDEAPDLGNFVKLMRPAAELAPKPVTLIDEDDKADAGSPQSAGGPGSPATPMSVGTPFTQSDSPYWRDGSPAADEEGSPEKEEDVEEEILPSSPSKTWNGGQPALARLVANAGEESRVLWLSRNYTTADHSMRPTAFISVPKELVCPVCQDVLLDPINYRKSVRCRKCVQGSRTFNVQMVPTDEGAMEKLLGLRILCRHGLQIKKVSKEQQMNNNKDKFTIHIDLGGCGHLMPLGDRIAEAPHEETCGYEPVRCGLPDVADDDDAQAPAAKHKHCRKHIRRKYLEKHRSECNFRLLPCSHEAWNEKVQARFLRMHITQCGHRPSKCVNAAEGCGWVGKAMELEEHVETCQYVQEVCGLVDTEDPEESCPETFHRIVVGSHRVKCSFATTQCRICKSDVSRRKLGLHESTCDGRFYSCNKCGETVFYSRRQQHDRAVCPEAYVKCEDAQYGCNHKFLRKDYLDHLKNGAAYHLELLLRAKTGYQGSMRTHEGGREDLVGELKTIRGHTARAADAITALKAKVADAAAAHAESIAWLDSELDKSWEVTCAQADNLEYDAESHRNEIREKALEIYSWLQDSKLRAEDGTVKHDMLDERKYKLEAVLTEYMEESHSVGRELPRLSQLLGAALEPLIARTSLLDIEHLPTLQQIRRHIQETHYFSSQKAVEAWRSLLETRIHKRLEQVELVNRRTNARLEYLERQEYLDTDKLIELNRDLKISGKFPDSVRLKQISKQITERVLGAEPTFMDLLQANITQEKPVYTVDRLVDEERSIAPTDDNLVLDALQQAEDTQWFKREIVQKRKEVHVGLDDSAETAAKIKELIGRLQRASRHLEGYDKYNPEYQDLLRTLDICRVRLAQTERSEAAAQADLTRLGAEEEGADRAIVAMREEVDAVADQAVVKGDDTAVAALSRMLITESPAQTQEAAEADGEEDGLQFAPSKDAIDAMLASNISPIAPFSPDSDGASDGSGPGTPPGPAQVDATLLESENALARSYVRETQAILDALDSRLDSPDDVGAARQQLEATLDEWRESLAAGQREREALAGAPPAGAAGPESSATAAGRPTGDAGGDGEPPGPLPPGRILAFPIGHVPTTVKVSYKPSRVLNGPKYGVGVRAVDEGEWYRGHWLKGKMNGREVYRWADGAQYEGAFWESTMQGRGRLKYPNGDVYEGQWKVSARHGVGAMRYRNGNVYEGSWMDDHRAGKGTMRFETGDVYEGEWRSNLQHGRGKFTSWNGDAIEGDWREGELAAEAKPETLRGVGATARTRRAKKVITKPRPKSLDVTKVRKPRPKPKVNPLASLGLPMPKNMVPLDPSILRPGRGRNMF